MAKSDKEKETPAETPTPAPSQGIVISLDALVGLGKEITELDTKIASASGSDTAAKKAIVDGLISENKERIDNGVTQYLAALEEVPLEVLVGLVQRLEDAIKEKFGESINKFVDEKYASTAGASKEQVGQLREARKAMVTRFKALREVLESFGQDTSSVADPKRTGGGRPAGSGGTSGGSGAKSGMNREGYIYTMDGKDRPQSQNTFSSLAYYSTEGCPTSDGTKRWGASVLKDFIKSKGVNFGEDETWEVELPNGKKIGARKMSDADKARFGGNGQAPESTDTAEASAEESAVAATA